MSPVKANLSTNHADVIGPSQRVKRLGEVIEANGEEKKLAEASNTLEQEESVLQDIEDASTDLEV